jgi:hypothetical protein
VAEGLAVGVANQLLNTVYRGATFTPPAAVWVQLHTDAPGPAGTANVATETTRIQAVFGDAADGGALSNTVDLEWVDVAGAEDYTHHTEWSASTNGTFLSSGLVTANAVAS